MSPEWILGVVPDIASNLLCCGTKVGIAAHCGLSNLKFCGKVWQWIDTG
jgi:hypothetical protein